MDALPNQLERPAPEPGPVSVGTETPEAAETRRRVDRQHYAAGRFAEAAQCLRAYLERHPDDPAAVCDLGIALVAQGQVAESVRWFQRALQLRAKFVPALINLGVALLKLNRLHEAAANLHQALTLEPDNPIACFNLGVALHSSRHHEEAVTWLRKAQALRPEHADTANELGNALRALERTEEAVEAYRHAIALRPSFVGAAHALGVLFQAERRFAEAVAAFRTALDAAPDRAELWNDFGSALQGACRHEEAVAAYRQSLALRPGLAAAHCNMALALASLGRMEEGIAACERAIAVEPGAPVPHMNMGCLLLTLGRFREGWEGYEYRFAIGDKKTWIRFEANAEPWLGESLVGKSILVLGEQGNGDHLHFARYLPLLVDLGASVTFLAPARLHRLFSSLRGPISLLADLPVARFDLQWPLMSLPLRFEKLGFPLPAEVPYLAAEPDRVAHWRERIGPAGFRVAIAWQGNRYAQVDFGRSYPLKKLQPLAAIPGVRLISLQMGEGTEQLESLPPDMKVEVLGPAFDAGEQAFLDAAAVMQAVDLVISSDTALAHLAGALGRPLWMALNSAPEWRWLRGRSDSPWYPTARLFRQPIAGDWDGVFAEMAPALAALARNGAAAVPNGRAAPPAPLIPVSWGELLDKLSILEIKAERLSDPAALANVGRELGSLRAALGGSGENPHNLDALRQRLRETNERLWDLEDTIRGCESEQCFDGHFVDVARTIYRVNDERSRIKRQINKEMGSGFAEEKHYRRY
ncbi:MAG: tetratricopeptide repeat protein [Acidisphaera sp.]|nr:tetratricopeptide repeat protein [Acidisphaera sp.]